MFKEYMSKSNIRFIEGDILKSQIDIEGNIDYIVHAASITDSRMFVEKPIETINTGIFGTEKILEFAKEKKVQSVVYLSSMEVYGQIRERKKIKEDEIGYINPLSVRSSYSESKRMIENICVSYFHEYGVPVKIIRLAQTFGPGVQYNDNRVFAEFARCVIEERDIVLYTEGKSERMYLYTYDAVEAIIIALIECEFSCIVTFKVNCDTLFFYSRWIITRGCCFAIPRVKFNIFTR